MKNRTVSLILRISITFYTAVVLTLVGAASSIGESSSRPLKVMTMNMYLGADLAPVLAATSFDEFATEVAAVYITVQQSDIPARAAALAAEIEAGQPDLVALQEVSLWLTGPFGGPADSVSYDALVLLLDALEARGLSYTTIAALNEFDAEAPSALGINIRFIDRDVVLARSDLDVSELKLANIQAQHFTTNLSFVTPVLGLVTIPRGWISVDGKIRGKSFRFINTHLESFHPAIQAIQSSELVLGPANTNVSVIMAGDLNTDSASGDPVGNAGYQILSSSGFIDLWSLINPGSAGNTWPLHLGDSLTATTPTQRIDLIFFKGEIDAVAVDLVLNTPAALTPAGRWPSDHAGVVGTFDLKVLD